MVARLQAALQGARAAARAFEADHEGKTTALKRELVQTQALLTAHQRAHHQRLEEQERAHRRQLEEQGRELDRLRSLAAGGPPFIAHRPGHTLYATPSSDRYAELGWPAGAWAPTFYVTCQPAGHATQLTVPMADLSVVQQPMLGAPPLLPRD